jgi:chemotaxis protein CheX
MIGHEITIDAEVLNEIAQGVFQTMLGIELSPGEIHSINDFLYATVEIAGAWNGSVSLAFSADLAHAAARRMLKLASSEVMTIDKHEVAAELTNMIGGNFKSLLPSPSHLSLPLVGRIRPQLPFMQVATLVSAEGELQLSVNEFASWRSFPTGLL